MSSCVLAGLVEQDDLVDVGGLEPWQSLRIVSSEPIKPPLSAASCAAGLARFQALYSSHMLTVPGAGRLRSFRGAVEAQSNWKKAAPSAPFLASSSVLQHMKKLTSAMLGLMV